MKAKTFKIVAFSVAGFLLALLIVLSAVVGAFAGVLDKFVVGYKDGGAASSAARAGGAKLAEQIQAEGTVLVKNKDENGNALLPLSKADAPQVVVLGWAATDWVISGSGSGQVKTSEGKKDDYTVTLLDALTEAGIGYYKGITDMYEKFADHREKSENGGGIGGAQANAGALKNFNYEFSRLYEPDIENTKYYTDTLLSEASNFSNTALVVIGRVSGESNDSPKVQYKKVDGKSSAEVVDKDRTYLEISTEEEKLLKYAGTNFDNVIVLINTTNVMELGFLETIDGLDAGLVVATTGTVGTRAIPKLIYKDLTEKDEDGKEVTVAYTPSGKLADTYAYDLSTSSTYVDTGSGNESTHFYTNSLNPNYKIDANGKVSGSKNTGKDAIYPTNVDHTNGSSDVPYKGAAYQDYRESVYMGYKWYETADKMGFWDSTYAKNKWSISKGYDDVVQYPFGFGLSYTTFSWEITYLEIPNGNTVKPEDTVKIIVRVTNTGSAPGQDVVELYYDPPYNKGGLEKASVNLIAFGKTQQILQPKEHEDITLEFTVQDMASYDYLNLSKTVANGGYVLEDGTYTLTLRTDAHTLAGKKMVNGVHNNDTLTYKVNGNTQVMEEAQNRFTGTNTTDGVAIDGNSDGSANITYLSRANFEGTFPAVLGDDREMTQAIKNLNLYSASQANDWDAAHDNGTVTFGNGSMVVGSEVEKTDDSGKKVKVYQLNDLGMKLGLDYNDPQWEELLNVIPKSTMEDLVLHGYTHTAGIINIGKPETLDVDGPNQIFSFTGSHPEATGFSSIVLAQSWSYQLAYSMGLTFAEEAASYGVSGWYGPGVNVHRSPFGGRNYEYYSEDALLSGVMCSYTVKAAKNKGVFCWLKHLCLYEGESGRDGMYTWVTEQALREIYLKPFEIAVRGDRITSPYMSDTERELDGTSSAIMTSYGRIGAVWTGGSEALLTEVVRGEWGYKGAFLTDYADHHDFMNGDQMLRAGGDTWMDWYDNSNPGRFICSTTSNAFNAQLKKATKNVIYTWMNALAVNTKYNEGIENGTISGSLTIPQSPELNFRWYIPVLIVVDVLLAAGAGVLIFFGIKKKETPVPEAATEASAGADPSAPVEENVEATETTEATEAPETTETPNENE